MNYVKLQETVLRGLLYGVTAICTVLTDNEKEIFATNDSDKEIKLQKSRDFTDDELL